ncbi:MAG: hypothetical protein HYV68_00300 [Candidatus Taylorbacteria bacterium]|nr:hypothetical protein [Candidatus Taylorbacteria bacterium]
MRTNPKQTPLNRIEKPPLPDRGTAEDHLMRVRRIIYKAKLGDNGTQAHKDLRKRIRKMTRELAAYAAEQVKWTRNEYRGI